MREGSSTLARKVVMALALAPVLTGLFVLALVIVFSLPNGPISGHLLERSDILDDRRTNNGRVIDADTECIGLSVGLYNSTEGERSHFSRAINAESLYGCEPLIRWLETGETIAHRDYFRYWHGYTIITRPVLSFLPYNDLRGHLFNISVILMGFLLWRLGKDFGARFALAFALPFFVLNLIGYWVVATKAVTWFLIAGGALYFSSPKKVRGEAPVLAFFVLGALTAFFDFLTAPMLVFVFPLFFYWIYANQAKVDAVVETPWKSLITLFLFWSGGYVILWSSKFVLAAWVLEVDVWSDVTGAVFNRLRGQSEYVDSFIPGVALYENFTSLKSFWGPVAFILFLALPVATKARRARWRALWRNAPVFFMLAVAPLVWMEALSNHTQIHAAFTHLNFAPAFVIASLVLFAQTPMLCSKAEPIE